MVCPICITTALVANAPAIAAASLGGAAAVKMCLNRGRAAQAAAAPKPEAVSGKGRQPRTLVDPIRIARYDEEEW